MKSFSVLVTRAAAGLALSLTISGCTTQQSSTGANDKAEAQPVHDAALVQVTPDFAKRIELKTEPVTKRLLSNNLHVTGEIHADVGKEIDVTARFSGRVVKVNVMLGDSVSQGQVLALVDSQENSDLQAELLEAKSKLKIAEAHEERERQIYNEHLHRPPALLEARTRYDEAKIHLELTQAEFERQQGLYREKIASQKDYMNVQAALAKAKLANRQTTADLQREERLYKNKAMLGRDVQLAHAETARARQHLETLKQRLKFLGMTPSMVQSVLNSNEVMGVVPLIASASGVITHHDVSVGEIIDPGKKAFMITDLRSVVVAADIPEVDLRSIRIGAPVSVTIASNPGEVFKGYVSYVSERVDPATRTVSIRARLDNSAKKFKSNMYAEIDLKGPPKMALAVPRSAVQERDGKKVVFVETPKGFTEKRIEVGSDTEDYYEVKSGLADGEKVATQGSLLLKTELTYQHSTGKH